MFEKLYYRFCFCEGCEKFNGFLIFFCFGLLLAIFLFTLVHAGLGCIGKLSLLNSVSDRNIETYLTALLINEKK